MVYPFAVNGAAGFIISRRGRERFPIPAAKLFALVGCVLVIWFVAKYGFGKIPAVTVIGSAVFLFGAAATGFLFGAILDLFVPASVGAHERPEDVIANGDANDDNPYVAPRSS